MARGSLALILVAGLLTLASMPPASAACGASVTLAPSVLHTVSEGAGTVSFTLTMASPAACSEMVGANIEGGSVTFPNDLRFPESSTEYTSAFFVGTSGVATVSVEVVDDGEVEDMEYTNLRFELPSGRFDGGSSRVAYVELRIEDNDAPGSEQVVPEVFLYHTGPNAVLTEGADDSPFLVGSNMDLQGAEVAWEVRVQSAGWDDFAAAAGSVTLEGQGPWRVPVQAWDDAVGEAWETALVCLTEGKDVTIVQDACLPVGIYENDGGPGPLGTPSTPAAGRIDLPSSLGQVWEGTTFVVRLDRGSTGPPASVQWALEPLDGSPSASPSTGTASWANGQLESEASFTVADDSASNPGRRLRFCLSSPSNLVLANSCAAVEVRDDEGAAAAPPPVAGVHVGATAASAKDLTSAEVERARGSAASRGTTPPPPALGPGGTLIPGLDAAAALAALGAVAIARRRR